MSVCAQCGNPAVYETRRTESASVMFMPLIEFRMRCPVCGMATRWYDDGAKAEAEWMLRFADKMKPGPLSRLFGFDAVCRVYDPGEWLTPPADGEKSKGESNGEVQSR